MVQANANHRPMLAAGVKVTELHKIQFPKILQIKYDGIRGTCRGGQMISRSGKLLPNRHVQSFFGALCSLRPEFNGCDGEFIIGKPNDASVCMRTTSGIMSHGGEPDFTFYAFDRAIQGPTYNQRRTFLQSIVDGLPYEFAQRIKLVSEFEVGNVAGVESHLSTFLGAGLEGCILRDPHSPYKFGRSTVKQGYLLKIKDIQEDEAIIVGYEELRRNLNEPIISELGFTKRSSHKDNKVAGNMLGAFIVRAIGWEGTFRIGTGFDMQQRQDFWAIRDEYVGSIVKFKYLRAGMKDLPRHPVFMGFRNRFDMEPSKLGALIKLGGQDVG